MRLIDGILYIGFSELEEEYGVSKNTLSKGKERGSQYWRNIPDPNDKRKVLFEYEALRDEYKAKIQARIGNPYDLVARQPILNMVIVDPAAHDYYFTYKYLLNGKEVVLTPKQIAQCTRAHAWLSLIQKVNDKGQWREIKDALGLKYVPEFFTHAGYLIGVEKANGKEDAYTKPMQLPGNFPGTYQRLKEKAAAFIPTQYDLCLPTGLGNKVAAKIGKAAAGFDPELERKQIALIRKVASMHNNFDAAQVARLVQPYFDGNGWQMVGSSRIYQILQDMRATTTPGRRGKRTYMSEVAMQVKRSRPQFPTSYFTLDGWDVELLYQTRDSKGQLTYHNRLVVVIVLDAHNNYPVGYAIGDRENTDLIREAQRNALLHLKEILGDYYRPNQLQSDNYGIKALTPFYQAVAHVHTPAAVGNAKSKVIEPYFKDLNKTYCQTQANWSGFGITASKKNQVNAEFLDKIKKTFPDREGVVRQIEAIIAAERAKKVAAYMEAFAAMPAELKQTINYLSPDWLTIFGQPVGGTNKLTGAGIIKTIAGAQYTYDSFEAGFRQNLHLDWQIIADPADLSRVLAVSPDGKQRFLLEEKMSIPMDLQGAQAEHHAYRSRITAYNKERMQEIIQTYTEDTEIVDEIVRNTPLALNSGDETALKLMLTYNGQQKEGIQDAKGKAKAIAAKHQARQEEQAATDWQAMQQAYLHSKTDFNKYLD